MNAPIHPLITLENIYAAANYQPLPVVLALAVVFLLIWKSSLISDEDVGWKKSVAISSTLTTRARRWRP